MGDDELSFGITPVTSAYEVAGSTCEDGN
jgi:hypothetical protein